MVPLEPEAEMEGAGTAFHAGTGTARLRIKADWPALAGRWVRLEYAQGFYDACVRPLLHLRLTNTEQAIVLPAPVAGRGLWFGRIHAETREAFIAPAMTAGPVNFRIDALAPVGLTALLARGLRHNPTHVAYAAALFSLGKRERAERRLSRAAVEAPPSGYAGWLKERERAFDPAFDRPRREGHRTQFVLQMPAADLAEQPLQATVQSLQAQIAPDWILEMVDLDQASEPARTLVATLGAEEPRIRTAPGTRAGGEITAELACGDVLRPHALSLVGDAFAADAGLEAVYGDAECREGRQPLLFSDWSPVAGASGHVPRPLFRRSDDGTLRSVHHLRRVIACLSSAPIKPAYTEEPLPEPLDAVTVIIPTRDRLELLRVAVSGVLDRTDYPALDLIIVDNDSTDAATLAYLDSLAKDPRVRVVRHPGAFNFSAICNHGAAEARGRILLFLNNDIEVTRGDWLRQLAGVAQRNDVGAVGAMLHYPDGRIQHAGVALGPAESAAHIYALNAADEPGISGELRVVREVSAVTAACLAVARDKFEAVGGFDAGNYAVTLNDIDLCLRLRERGWRSMFTPLAVLTHHESASRPRNRVYGGELAAFRARWADLVRDDPNLHPALSVAALTPTLG